MVDHLPGSRDSHRPGHIPQHRTRPSAAPSLEGPRTEQAPEPTPAPQQHTPPPRPETPLAPSTTEPGPSPAYLALARLGRNDHRLALSADDCTALEAQATQWLARGVSVDYLTSALTAGLPATIDSPPASSAAASPPRSRPDSPPKTPNRAPPPPPPAASSSNARNAAPRDPRSAPRRPLPPLPRNPQQRGRGPFARARRSTGHQGPHGEPPEPPQKRLRQATAGQHRLGSLLSGKRAVSLGQQGQNLPRQAPSPETAACTARETCPFLK